MQTKLGLNLCNKSTMQLANVNAPLARIEQGKLQLVASLGIRSTLHHLVGNLRRSAQFQSIFARIIIMHFVSNNN